MRINVIETFSLCLYVFSNVLVHSNFFYCANSHLVTVRFKFVYCFVRLLLENATKGTVCRMLNVHLSFATVFSWLSLTSFWKVMVSVRVPFEDHVRFFYYCWAALWRLSLLLDLFYLKSFQNSLDEKFESVDGVKMVVKTRTFTGTAIFLFQSSAANFAIGVITATFPTITASTVVRKHEAAATRIKTFSIESRLLEK